MKWRFRTNWLGKLILQIGRLEPSLDRSPGEHYIKWADAKVDDFALYYDIHGETK